MSNLNIAVIFGGKSSEHEVSINSAANIILSMDEKKYNIIPIYITKAGSWLLYEGGLDNFKNVAFEKFGTPCILNTDPENKGLIRLSGGRYRNINIDCVFPVLHGENGEDGTIQGLFEIAGIPYIGSGVFSSSCAMDKTYTKKLVNYLDIPQANHIVVVKNKYDNKKEEILKDIRYKIKYPCFIKPARTGSSVGVSKAGNKEEVEKAIEEAFKFDNKLVVENAIIGRELECAVLGNGGEETLVSGIGEIIFSDTSSFYDYKAKYEDTSSQTIISPKLDNEIIETIREYSLKIFNILECKGLARVDFFLEKETNKVIFNEINTMPGFTDISMYPMLIGATGVDKYELVDRLINLAMENGRR